MIEKKDTQSAKDKQSTEETKTEYKKIETPTIEAPKAKEEVIKEEVKKVEEKKVSTEDKEVSKPVNLQTKPLGDVAESMENLVEIEKKEEKEPSEPSKAKSTSEPKFLYVEDDNFSREIMERMIKKVMGYSTITIFSDSTDFMKRVKELDYVPDVIFLDVQIGPISGPEMLKLLRAEEKYRDTKIIALTASVMAPEVQQLKDQGFDGLIGKPIPKRLFPDLLKRILEDDPTWYVS